MLQRPQQSQAKSPEVEVVATKSAPKRERQVEVSRTKEAAKIPPLPAAPPPPPVAPPPPPTHPPQQKPAATVDSADKSFPSVRVKNDVKRGLQVKVTNQEAEARLVDHSRKRPAKDG